MLVVGLLGCSPRCPGPMAADPPRAERIRGLAALKALPTVCFGWVPDGGVRDGQGRLLLAEEADDAWLAARVRHLVRHVDQVDRGPGCEARLRQNEAEAWAVELEHRARLGVEDPNCPVASGPGGDVARISAWLRHSHHPRAVALRDSHTRRCVRAW